MASGDHCLTRAVQHHGQLIKRAKHVLVPTWDTCFTRCAWLVSAWGWFKGGGKPPGELPQSIKRAAGDPFAGEEQRVMHAGSGRAHTSLSGRAVPQGNTNSGILPSGLRAQYCSDPKPPSSFGEVMSISFSRFFL